VDVEAQVRAIEAAALTPVARRACLVRSLVADALAALATWAVR
jgi:hypothetical protein